MPTKPKIRLLVVDDHEMVRRGVKALLAGTEIEVAAEASTGNAAVKLALSKQVDLVLLDVVMPDGDGLTALGHIKRGNPKLPVLLFSAFDNLSSIGRAVALAASGFLLKGCTREKLLNAIRKAAAGESAWNHATLRAAKQVMRTPRVGTLEVSLSRRWGDVLRHMANGLSNEQIAEAMNIGREAVKTQGKHIFPTIGVVDRTQAAVWAVRNGLV